MKKLSLVLLATLGLAACGDNYGGKTIAEIGKLSATEQEKAVEYVKDKLGNKFKEQDVEMLRMVFEKCADTQYQDDKCNETLDSLIKIADTHMQ